MVDVVTEIIICKPIDIVADYAANPDHAPEWYANIKSADWKTPKPLTVVQKSHSLHISSDENLHI